MYSLNSDGTIDNNAPKLTPENFSHNPYHQQQPVVVCACGRKRCKCRAEMINKYKKQSYKFDLFHLIILLGLLTLLYMYVIKPLLLKYNIGGTTTPTTI